MPGTLLPRPEREEQALREAGRTKISATSARFLTLLFLVTVLAVPITQAVVDLRATDRDEGTIPGRRLASLLAEVPRAAGTLREEGFLAANRRLRLAIERFEDTQEEESFLRRSVLPPTQAALTGLLGAGNEQAYVGRDGWLFYRGDFDHVTGPGFLEPEILARRLTADPGAEPPRPDPLPAILALHAMLGERGIELVLLPTPVKPQIHPERLTARSTAGEVLRNPSYGELLDRLEAAGIELFDASRPLLADRTESEGQYLRADTHWTPTGMEAVARELAGHLEDRVEWARPPVRGYRQRVAVVEGVGDIAAMLRLPAPARLFPPQRVEVARVLAPDGRPWRPDRAAEVLLLGDSFTNIYSDAALGWGSGAGFAEQLSFHLGRPVDRIALNAGGAWSSRQALARAAGSDPARLADKRVVIYQFATRELSGGDWRPTD
jgi:alginate O-acetyltransferase complex protein AlgJ